MIHSMSLSQDEASRLAFIRYLNHQAAQQGRLPEPQSSTAVLLLHDAVEAFLLLAAEHLGAAPPREFGQYWDVLSPAKLTGGVDLAVKQGMVRLNKIRVNLKHHGVPPGRAAIDKSLADTATFFAANTRLVFDIDYDQVSMADVIEQEKVRELVRKAEAANAGADHISAMIALSDACELLLLPRSTDSWRPSPLRFGDNINWASGHPFVRRVGHALQPSGNASGFDNHANDRQFLAEHIGTVTKAVIALQEAARVTALGIDYAAYLQFVRLTPSHVDTTDGKRQYQAPKGYAPTRHDVEFCHQFVVSASLRLTEAHAHLAPPPWLAGGPQSLWEPRETIATGTFPREGYL
jgi:hypothetical protein